MTEDEVISEEAMELLFLLDQLKTITRHTAALKLEVDDAFIEKITGELENKEYIESEVGYSDPTYRLTKKGKQEIQEIHKGLEFMNISGKKKKKKKKLTAKQKISNLKEKIKKTQSKIKTFLRKRFYDITVTLLTLTSIYLLILFINNPNAQMFSFLLGALFLSIVFIIYNRYKEQLKTRIIIFLLKRIEEKINQKRGAISALSVTIGLIYLGVMIFLHQVHVTIYVYLGSLLLSTPLILYSPETKLKDIIKFYVGISFIMASIFLISGKESITVYLLEDSVYLFDLLIALILLYITYNRREKFGLSIDNLRKVFEEIK